jgi:hypothetical protein
MERFLFLVSFHFLSIRIWQLLYLFLSHFWFRFFVKGVLLWCLTCVCVDKKIVQFFVYLVIDIYDFFYTWSKKNDVKIQIQTTRCQHFGSN